MSIFFQTVFLVIAAAHVDLQAQSTGSSSAVDQSPRSLPNSPFVLYHFLRTTAYINRTAIELNAKDGSGKSMTDAFVSTVGVTGPDVAALFEVASTMDAQFQALDAQAAKIITDAKSKLAGGPLPPPPSELVTLQSQKMTLMSTLATVVRGRLSTAGVNRVADYVTHISTDSKNAAVSQR